VTHAVARTGGARDVGLRAGFDPRGAIGGPQFDFLEDPRPRDAVQNQRPAAAPRPRYVPRTPSRGSAARRFRRRRNPIAARPSRSIDPPRERPRPSLCTAPRRCAAASPAGDRAPLPATETGAPPKWWWRNRRRVRGEETFAVGEVSRRDAVARGVEGTHRAGVVVVCDPKRKF
jgi:hypothetical protein